jgi:alpha-beta hydrolase superfamily lysophospholipase
MRRMASITMKAAIWVLAAVGLVAIVLCGMLSVPIGQLPTLESVSRTARTVDRSDMPAVSKFQARDGTWLAYRHYPAAKADVARVAILVHGSSGSGASVHALARALAAQGVETFTPDIRGHGASGSRGDIGYLGQLDDDMADLVGEVRKTRPDAPLTLLGHSAGGGFALHIAGSPIQNLFERTILIAPYLGYDAPTNYPHSGGWAEADIPRFLALIALNRLGLTFANDLPTLTFAVRANSELTSTRTYSFRLMRNFATRDYRNDLAAATHPVTIFAGSADEMMIADQYQNAAGTRANVRIIDGVNHVGAVSDPKAVSAIAEDVAKFGLSS